MLRTSLCKQLGIDHPVIQAPIGGISTVPLAVAVSNAGGLGSFSGTWRDPQTLRRMIRETRAATERPYMVNLVLSFDIGERLEICLDESVPIIGLFWGEASAHISRIHAAGSLAMVNVGSAKEARMAVDSGADILVAQGLEAGGHVWGTVGTLPLIPSIVDAVPKTAVVAAGGIADGRGLAAVLCLGAAGAMLGTRFVMSVEANAHPRYQQAIAEASEADTVYLANLFDGGWENAPHRVIANSTYRKWMKAGAPASGARPQEGEVVATGEDGREILRYSNDAPTQQIATGNPEGMALYAGQGTGMLHTVEPAARIVYDLAADAERVLRELCSL